MAETYNPLDKFNLGKSVGEALLEKEACPLGELPQFPGAGIYALYYFGEFAPYERLRKANASEPRVPIYVGKAIPSGGRKGLAVFTESTRGRYLYNRLQDHADSVRQARNLRIADFSVRWLAVDDIWIPLGETLLIEKFRPVWNQVLDGFGNHDPGAGRYNGLRPMWDTLHPGRTWAERCKERPELAEELSGKISDYLRAVPIADSPQVK